MIPYRFHVGDLVMPKLVGASGEVRPPPMMVVECQESLRSCGPELFYYCRGTENNFEVVRFGEHELELWKKKG